MTLPKTIPLFELNQKRNNDQLLSNDNFDRVTTEKIKPETGISGLETLDSAVESDKGIGYNANLSQLPNLYKQTGSVVSQRFIKFIPSETSDWLLEKHPKAFLLLALIAQRARRFSGHPDGFEIGWALVGDHDKCGLSRQEYRSNLKFLSDNNFLELLHFGKKDKKSTINPTIKRNVKGTIVKLIDSRVWDINIEVEKNENNHHVNHHPTITQPSPNHEQERRKNEERKKKDIKEATDRAIAPVSPLSNLKSEKQQQPSVFEAQDKKDLSEEAQKHFQYLWQWIIENEISITHSKAGITEKDLIAWLKKYPAKEILENLKRCLKAEIKTSYPRYIQGCLNKKIVKENEDSQIGKKLVEEFVKKNKCTHLTLKQDYVIDEISKDQVKYSLYTKSLSDFLEKSFSRFKDHEMEDMKQNDYNDDC